MHVTDTSVPRIVRTKDILPASGKYKGWSYEIAPKNLYACVFLSSPHFPGKWFEFRYYTSTAAAIMWVEMFIRQGAFVKFKGSKRFVRIVKEECLQSLEVIDETGLSITSI